MIALQRAPGGAPGSRSPGSRAGTVWAVITGLTIAAYSVVDKGGVARLNPVPYLVLLGLGSSALLAPVAVRQPGGLRAEWAVNARHILVASAMNLSAYLMVLFAFRLTKVGYVVAARQLSIVLSAVIGSWWLGEGRLGGRLAGAAVARESSHRAGAVTRRPASGPGTRVSIGSPKIGHHHRRELPLAGIHFHPPPPSRAPDAPPFESDNP